MAAKMSCAVARKPWLLVAILPFLSAAAAGQDGSADGVEWSAAQRLVWSDFQGPVDPRASAETVAMTAASLGWRYGYELERADGRCSFRITDVVTQAVFHPEMSWVRPEHRTESILEHEQGHFDLTEVHKRMLDAAVEDLVGVAMDCGRRRATIERIESRVAAILEPAREEIWNGLARVQAEYDAATRHGIVTDAQEEWTERIRSALRRGRWE